MYDREHRFFASALVVSLVACIAFAAALGLAPSQKAYASDVETQASGYTEVQLLEYINTNIETMLTGFGMLGENTSQTHPTFRWLYTAINQINSYVFQIFVKMDDIQDNTGYIFNRLGDLRDALAADNMTINGQTFTTPRGFLNQISDRTYTMDNILLAWNKDMGATHGGADTNATWFSTVSSSLLSTLNAINSANTNLISIDSKFWEYFLVPQRWQQQDGSYYYSPAYYFQYLQLQYDQIQRLFLTSNQISVDGTNYKTPHWYLNNINDMIVNTNYYTALMHTDVGRIFGLLSQEQLTVNDNTVVTPYYYLKNIDASISGMKTDTDLLVKLFSQETVSIGGQTVYTPYYFLMNILRGVIEDQGYNTKGNNTYTVRSLLIDLRSFISGMKTDADLLVKLFSQETVSIGGQTVYTPYYFLMNILRGVVEDQAYNTKGNNTYTVRSLLTDLRSSIGHNTLGWINAENNLANSLSDYRTSWNSFVIMVHDYLDSLIYLMETPDSNTSQQLIGDFDDEAYAQNMQDLRQQLGQVGVFSAVSSLGMIVYTISDADSLQTPSLDVPFEFAGSNDHLVIDLSWLDDFKPMINFACMALLFLQLSAWTVEAVKET